METVFELITMASNEKAEEKECRLGIRVNVAGYETVCPVTRPCNSYKDFFLEVQNIRKSLDLIMSHAKETFEKPSPEDLFGITSDMRPEEVWAILSKIADDVFISTFNSMEEAKRREVAEHVLTKCNIFSGKASVFSSRYADDMALME